MICSPRARFQLSEGPGSQGTIAAQFNCEGTTLSGVEFELVGIGYRVSLVKRRFVSGKLSPDISTQINSDSQAVMLFGQLELCLFLKFDLVLLLVCSFGF